MRALSSRFTNFSASATRTDTWCGLNDQSLCSQASSVRCHQCFPHLPPEHFSLRKMWFMRHLQDVDVFTCPSSFMIDRYVAWGIDAGKDPSRIERSG